MVNLNHIWLRITIPYSVLDATTLGKEEGIISQSHVQIQNVIVLIGINPEKIFQKDLS